MIGEEGEDASGLAVAPTIERQRIDADPSLAGRSVKKTFRAVEHWPFCQLNVSLVRMPPEYRMTDSIRKPGQEAPEHQRGEVKKGEHRRIHWWLSAAYPDLKLAFLAHWEQKRGRTARSAPAFTFSEAACADPVGMPVELFADYSLGWRHKKQKKEEPEWAHAERVARMEGEALDRDIRYNTGTSYLNRRPVFRAFREFEQWLTEANEMVAQAARRKENA